MQVILLDLEKREKFENKLLREPPGPPETADLGGSAQASMLLLVGFAFLRSGSYQRLSETSYGFRSICYLRCVPGSYRFGIGGRSVANRSLLVGIRSVLGRLSDGNWCFPLGF